MSEPAPELDFELDVSHLVTEDDAPVDNPFQDKQMRLLTESLYSSWKPPFEFVAMSDVGLYYSLNESALVPDVLVSTKVRLPERLMEKRNRSYFVWEYGKVPDLVIEIVSNREGGELTHKREGYLERHVPYYVVYDPGLYLSDRALRCFEYSPSGYLEMVQPFFSLLSLGLALWEGCYETYQAIWLRWCGPDKALLPTGLEASELEKARADGEKARADGEKARADGEKARADGEKARADEEKARADELAAANAQLLERFRAAGLE
jgi:Uma2 family endonuclease